MKRTIILIITSLALGGSAHDAAAWDEPFPLIVNHHMSRLDQVPGNWIDSVKTMRCHYTHTSHGGQLTVGCARIESADASYAVEIGSSYLPDVAATLCVFDGQEHETYIIPELYWQTAAGMNYTRDVLDHNPSITVSMFAWCGHMEFFDAAGVEAYFDSMAVLEQEYPDVTFIYMTGHAQTDGSYGYNRYLRNNQIRAYCAANNKVLFDFAALDSHWYNEQSGEWEFATTSYEGHVFPIEHPQFHGDDAMHTTYESCEQKGRAMWTMLAVIAGWLDYTIASDPQSWGGFKKRFK
jgi:hypothetical protein